LLDATDKVIDVKITLLNLLDIDEVNGIIVTAKNITDEKRLEHEKNKIQIDMVSQSKLATIGEVATGVAHEINQPLAYISSSLQNIKRRMEKNNLDPSYAKEKLERSLSQVDRITKIILHMRRFGRDDTNEFVDQSLPESISNVLLLLEEKIRLKSIILTINQSDNLPLIRANSNQIEQVFINLFQNSIDALEHVETTKKITVNIYASEDNQFIETTFEDNGSGIPKSIIEKIFTPFFTSKEVGKGTGIGLSICHGIIKDHKGSIDCISAENEYTRFTICLPALT
jgi:C4-dicarboxylate-specific signal transduction histidine kinase